MFVQVANDLLDPILVLDGVVESELEFGHAAQAEASADLPAHVRRRPVERLRRFLARLLVAKRGVEDAGELKVGGDGDPRQRDEADAGIVNVAARQHFAELLANLVADTVGAESLRHLREEFNFRARDESRLDALNLIRYRGEL